DDNVYSENRAVSVQEMRAKSKVLLAGIAKPATFFDYLKSDGDTVLQFPDHHPFSEREVMQIVENANHRPIVTTEKDYVRLYRKLPAQQLYHLPIKSTLISNQEQFDKTILNYVGKSSTNS